MPTQIGTLMLVDDSEVDQMIYARIINRSGVVRALKQFVDPALALDDLLSARQPVPDLILLDINMPGLDGFEFLDAMDAQLSSRDCPAVAMLSSSMHPDDHARAKAFQRVRNYLKKPLTWQHLHDLGEQFGEGPT